MHLKTLRKIVSVLSSFVLLFNSLSLPLYAYAQEEPVQEQEQTEEPAQTTEPTSIPESQSSPEATATPTEEATPSPEVSPSPEASAIPEETPTPIPASEEVLSVSTENTPTSEGSTNENAQSQAPPSETLTVNPTPTAPSLQIEEGNLSTTIVQEGETFPIEVQSYENFTVTTDKLDYAPTDTAVITGTNFTPGETYTLTISSDDLPATSTLVSITTDENGGFIYAYQLDGNYRPNYKIEVRDIAGNLVATATFTDGGAKINKLYTDSGFTNEGYQFALGDTVYVQASSLNTTRGYKLEAKNASGASAYLGTCKTGSTTATDSYAPTTISGSTDWTWVLHEWTSSTCASGAQSEDADNTKAFNVAQSTAYTSSSLGTTTTTYATGATAYVVVNGLDRSNNDWSVTWIKPDTTTACTNTSGGDRPDSTSAGVLPDAAPAYLEFPPSTGSNNWNDPTKYNGACTSGDAGVWKLALTADGTHSVTLSVFTVVASDTTDPTDPTPVSSSHTASTWSSDTTIDVTWSGASDGSGSGVDGFYTEWNTSPTTIAGPATKEYEETDSSEESPALATGQDHYFHIATVDNAGNWTSTAHLGPFWIDADDPAISLDSPTNGSLLLGTVSLQASASDTGSGLNPVEFSYKKSTDVAFTSIGIDGTDPYALDWDTTSVLDGDYTIRAAASDNSGRISWSDVDVTIDNTAPIITVDTLTTNDTSPALSGTIDDDSATISLTVDGNTYGDAYTNGDGTWSFDSGTIVPDLFDGTYDVSVSATDTAGNVGSDTTTDELIVDATAPVVTVDNLLTSDNTPSLTGTVDDTSASINVTVDGNVYSATNNGDGTWTLTDNTISPALADGVYDISLTATDSVGNSGNDSTTDELTVDTTTPTGNWTNPLDGGTVSGVVSLEGTAADTGGSGVTSVEFQYKRNDGVDSFHSISTDTSDPYSASWDTTSLALDNYTLRMVILDNTGNSTNVDITVGVSAVVSNESESSSTYGTATVTWTTSQPTKSRVVYDTVSHSVLGASPNYGYAFSTGTTDTNPKVTSHTVTLTGLSNGTTYYYRTVSEGSPVAVSNENSFQTLSTAGAPGSSGGGGVVAGISTTAFFAPLVNFLTPETVSAEEVLGQETEESVPSATPTPEVKGAETPQGRNWLWLLLALPILGGGYYLYRRRFGKY